MRLTRSLGIQLHPTSLPGGRLGPDAYAFVDWLAAAGASWWQVLPLNPPDAVGSPYSSASAFASWGGLLADPDATVEPSAVRAFCDREVAWIRDWEAFAGAGAVEEQVRFEREWTALRDYARSRGIRIVGDVPIYVARDGCDHRSHPELFLPVDEVVAGAPPDLHTPRGQLWGNPLFDWAALAETGYRWWIERMGRVLRLVDSFRIDHFRGFAGYWTVPAQDRDARGGRWSPGPGRALFEAAEAALGPLPVIAEDLGIITPDVIELRKAMGYPGMVVFLWSLPGGLAVHRLEHHVEQQVVYSSTHDTDTLAGEMGASDVWPLLEQCLASRCGLAVLPVQDVLGLGSEARMNTPGVVGGNWQWRLEEGQLTLADAERLRAAAVASGRAEQVSD
ncbi:MAG TPA: 4-alpha-glucanotransferase [Gaiella sp.]